jgi:hypothetical protein
MIPNQRVLILGFVWPKPNSSAAGGRMVQLISIFKQQGFEVTFANPAMDSDYMIDLEALGVSKIFLKLFLDSGSIEYKNKNLKKTKIKN